MREGALFYALLLTVLVMFRLSKLSVKLELKDTIVSPLLHPPSLLKLKNTLNCGRWSAKVIISSKIKKNINSRK